MTKRSFRSRSPHLSPAASVQSSHLGRGSLPRRDWKATTSCNLNISAPAALRLLSAAAALPSALPLPLPSQRASPATPTKPRRAATLKYISKYRPVCRFRWRLHTVHVRTSFFFQLLLPLDHFYWSVYLGAGAPRAPSSLLGRYIYCIGAQPASGQAGDTRGGRDAPAG